MAECPVCGMEIDEFTAVTAEVNDDVYYFCSRNCRDTFLAEEGVLEDYEEEYDEEYSEEYDEEYEGILEEKNDDEDDEYDDEEETK
ncbi:MAG TPA: hypothetical protein PKJ77_04290 [Thermodesulfobacteriota bacterium]|nr:YHS domain-containing protein [Deltaproteobacteria bacterium]HOC38476.1 hypothetical protein [Thermodesulfobacteriota bacterium]